LSEQDAVTAWLNDTELFRLQQLSYAQLQQSGRAECGWRMAMQLEIRDSTGQKSPAPVEQEEVEWPKRLN
jgi:hypothetical protein